MLDRDTAQKILDLLSDGISMREVARRLGVSKATVANVRDGKGIWFDEPKKPEITAGKGEPERCPECGRLVVMPCIACQVTVVGFVTKDAPKVTAEIELKPEHRRRYEQVKAWRESYKNPNFGDIPADHPLRTENNGPTKYKN